MDIWHFMGLFMALFIFALNLERTIYGLLWALILGPQIFIVFYVPMGEATAINLAIQNSVARALIFFLLFQACYKKLS
jgi:hypothetical protein